MVEYYSPELLDIFSKIVIEDKKYCYVCLRSEDERRLVKPVAFIKFVLAVNTKTNGPVHFVCHVCEKQAANALKVLRATTFASTLNLILKGLTKRNLKNKTTFHKKFYNGILRKNSLSDKLTPCKVQDELKCVRKSSGLVETDILIIDNKLVYESSTPTSEKTKRLESNQQVFHDAIIECPIRPVERCTTPAILPEPTAGVKIHNNTSTEPCIIIDEDEDSIKDPLNLQPSQEQQPVPNKPLTVIPTAQLMPPPILNNNIVVTLDPPQIVTFQELLQKPSRPNVNFILHPVFLDIGGNFNVPSMSGFIINGTLIIYEGQIIRSTRSLGVNMDIVRQNLLSNNEVFLQNYESLNPVDAIDSCQTEESCQAKKMKLFGRNGAVVGKVSSHEGSFSDQRKNVEGKSSMNTIKISDISCGVGALRTDSNRNLVEKTDWEDKIPMDVISFMDAVDPNASTVLSRMQDVPSLPVQKLVSIPMLSVSPLPMQVGPPRSLKTNPIEAEIIDLC